MDRLVEVQQLDDSCPRVVVTRCAGEDGEDFVASVLCPRDRRDEAGRSRWLSQMVSVC